jgi:hypothetical protein
MISSRMFFIIAVAILPIVATQGYSELALYRARKVEVQNHVLSLAKLTAARQRNVHCHASFDEKAIYRVPYVSRH